MSVPLDRLYQYIETIANREYGDSVVIYRFWPHGSKNYENLKSLHDTDWLGCVTRPMIICNDQEPLDYDFYENPEKDDDLAELLRAIGWYQSRNLRKVTSIFDNTILIHSEKNSKQIEKYQNNNFLLVYYWSHAFISLDWFRYAQHINQHKKTQKKLFLIYNRAWSGTREYRIKFVENVVTYGLPQHCQLKFNCVDPESGTHYQQHEFQNKNFKPSIDLSNIFEINDNPSHSSADFVIADYESTDIEIVLETIFDDERLYLTEKTLRPIACEQPFILVAPAGSLNYLKSYGFKTFSEIWDESYDNIYDPVQRLDSIAILMKTISQWDDITKQIKLLQAQEIATFNKKHFFSKKFFKQIEKELSINLSQALTELVDSNTSQRWLTQRKLWSKHETLKKIITGKTTRFHTADVMEALKLARKYITRHQKNK